MGQLLWTFTFRLAKNLFRVLKRSSAPEDGGLDDLGNSPLVAKVDHDDGRRVLGKYYQRKTRPRQLIQPLKPHQNGNLILPFTTLKCAEIREPSPLLPPIPQDTPTQLTQLTCHEKDERDRLTVQDILPELATKDGLSRKAEPWRKIHKRLASVKHFKMASS